MTRFRLACGLAVALLLPIGSVGLGASLAQSPASGHAQVIAQGVAALPSGEIAWRATWQTTAVGSDVMPSKRQLGFVLADLGPVLVTDGDDETLLQPGEASFVRGGARQSRAGAARGEIDYLAIELVPASRADNAGDGQLVHGGAPFTAPAGKRDLSLVRDVLAPEERGELPGGSAPTLLVVTGGALRVTIGETTVTVEAGAGAELDGAATLAVSGANPATYVAAVIGPEVDEASRGEPPATSAPEPQPTAEPSDEPADGGPGAIGVIVYACPPGVTVETATADDCPPDAEAVELELANPDLLAEPRTTNDAVRGSPGYQWQDLPLGTYAVTAVSFAPPYAGFSVDGSTVAGGSDGADYTVTIDDENPTTGIVVYVVQPGDEPGSAGGPGSIGVGFYGCPEGVAPDAFDLSSCTPLPYGEISAWIESESLNVSLSAEFARLDGNGHVTWTNLPLGPYALRNVSLPRGYDAYVVHRTQPSFAANESFVELTEGSPSAEFFVFGFVTGGA